MSAKGYWSGVQRRRVSRRQILGTAAVGGAGLALAACGKPSTTNTGAPTTGGKVGGQAGSVDKIAPGHYERSLPASKEELNAAQNAKRGGTAKILYLDPPHFDAALSYSCTLYATHELVYNKAIRAKLGPQSDPFKLEPDLAEKWEQTAPDATEFVFNFRKNVKWQNKAPLNGRPFTAEDAKLVFERYQAGGAQKDFFSSVDKWEMPDQYTLRVKLKEPFAEFPASLATYGYITPRELWSNSDKIKTEAIGTGPFIRESWTPKQGSTFVRNPDYWEMGADGKPLPYLDRLETTTIPGTEQQAIDAAFITRAVYHSPTVPDSKNGQSLLSSAPDTVWFDLPQSRGGNVNGLIFNLKNPKFQDKRVRNAISMGIDRIGLDRLLYDGLSQGFSATAIPWAFYLDQQPKLEEQGPTFQYNPDEARKLLKAAGADNLEFELVHYYLFRSAPIIQDMLRQIGVKVNVRAIDNPTSIQIHTARNYPDTTETIWGPPNYSIDGWLSPFYLTGGGLNYNFVSDPELDKMIKDQRRETDATKRKALLKQISQRLNDQNYEVWWPQAWYREAWAGFVKNFRPHGFAGTSQCYATGQFRSVWVDKA
jgi:peptide/nickel transport system substrate-binding protein